MDRLPSTFGSVVPELLVFEIVSGGQGTCDHCCLAFRVKPKKHLQDGVLGGGDTESQEQ